MAADARSRGWGWPGRRGSTQEASYRRDHIITIEAGGISLAVHREVAPLLKGFIDEIAAKGYPIDKVADDWGFANRPIRGYPDDNDARHKSNHAWGLAVDLNATRNPMTSDGRVHTDMPAWVIDAAARWGLAWGGAYAGARKDPMHFEFLGTPEDARRIVNFLKAPPAARVALPHQPKEPTDVPATFRYKSTQRHILRVEDDGSLSHHWTEVDGKFSSETLSKGCKPGTVPAVVLDDFGIEGRIDVWADADAGGLVHAWFNGKTWSAEKVA